MWNLLARWRAGSTRSTRKQRRFFAGAETAANTFTQASGTDGRKMSKSYGNTVLLTDPEPVIRQKLKSMVTDPRRIRRSDSGDPDVCPVGHLHKSSAAPRRWRRFTRVPLGWDWLH